MVPKLDKSTASLGLGKHAAIILSGGMGSRFASDSRSTLPKQFSLIENVPVLVHSALALKEMDCFASMVVVSAPENISETRAVLDRFSLMHIKVIAGGRERSDSSRLALEWMRENFPECDRVAIHDGCRPFLSSSFRYRIRRALEDRTYSAWIPGIPVTETLKKIAQAEVQSTVDRKGIYRIQTPQIFDFDLIAQLAEKSKNIPDFAITDDASLCEYFGVSVGFFDGDERNIKLTYPYEIEILRPLLAPRKDAFCERESDTTYTA